MDNVIKELENMGIAQVVDGYKSGKKRILELLEKEKLTNDEKIELMFEVNVFLSCI